MDLVLHPLSLEIPQALCCDFFLINTLYSCFSSLEKLSVTSNRFTFHISLVFIRCIIAPTGCGSATTMSLHLVCNSWKVVSNTTFPLKRWFSRSCICIEGLETGGLVIGGLVIRGLFIGGLVIAERV